MNWLDNETTCKNCGHSLMNDIFTDEDFNQLENNRTEMTYENDNIIIKQGSFVSQFFYLKKGVVKIVIEGLNGRDTLLKIVEDKNFIALPVIGKPDIYPFSVISVTDCSFCVLRKETIIDIMKRNPAANSYLLQNCTQDFQYLYNRISALSTRNNHGKLATTLLHLMFGGFKNDMLTLLSRKELAQLSSISVESANKILVELKQDKIIDIEKNTIKILQPEKIKKLSLVG